MRKTAPPPHADWLADFTPLEGALPAPQAAMLGSVLEINQGGGDEKPGSAKARKPDVGQRPMPPLATTAQPGSSFSPQGFCDGLIYSLRHDPKQVQKQFPAAKAGKRASRNGVLHWFLIDPKLGPLAGPLQ